MSAGGANAAAARAAGRAEGSQGEPSGEPAGRRVSRVSRVSAPMAVLVLAVTGVALIAVALIAGRVGPWVATPPAISLPTVNPPTISAPAITGVTFPSAEPRSAAWPAGWLIGAGIVLAVLVALLLVVWLVRVLRRPRPPKAGAVGANALRSGVALSGSDEPGALVEDTDERTFDPRISANAIIATWASLESAAAEAGTPRRPASTPTEFLAAVEQRYPPPPDEERTDRVLLGLYHRARFDTATLAPGAAVEAAAAASAIRRRFSSPPADAPAEPGSAGGGPS